MITVNIIGAGNVGSHLGRALSGAGFPKAGNVELKAILTSNPGKLVAAVYTCDFLKSFADLEPTDVTLLCVPDDSIAEVSKKISYPSLVVHTSGTVPIEVLGHERRGIFYPLQSFSSTRNVDLADVPFCLEASSEKDYKILENMVLHMGAKSYALNGEARKKLHLAAVFANNFTNHLYGMGFDICEREGIPKELLLPLIQETAAKIQNMRPRDAQTGPARRGDMETLKEHLNLLETETEGEIYKQLTNAILKTYGRKKL